jgi:hypothetical protein
MLLPNVAIATALSASRLSASTASGVTGMLSEGSTTGCFEGYLKTILGFRQSKTTFRN